MSELNTLSRLSGENQPRVPIPRRPWFIRIVLPITILILTALTLVYSARESLWPATETRVVRVVVRDASTNAGDISTEAPSAQSVSVQAPGWVEPDPFPLYVSALTDGVIERVFVLEGDRVEAGQAVARMIEDDARLTLGRAEAELKRRRAKLDAAEVDWQNPVALKRAVSVSRAMVSETVAARAQLDAEVAQQEARLKELQAAYERVRKLLPNAASELEVDQAKFRVEAQQSLLESTRRQRPVLDATIARYRAEAEAAERDLELRVDHRRALDEARASVKDAETAVAEAKLRLKRTEVTSPVSGIVMRRLAAPGAKMMLGMDSPHSAHVVHLYDPEKLQVRVDVPLADAAKVGVGQSAEVVVDVLPDETFRGEVTRFVHEADISKNTVEVKVAIEEPSALLKPDMLARVKFFGASDGAASPPGESSTTGATRVYVPEEVIRDDAGERVVWAVRPDQTVERRVIATGATRGDGWIEVTSGLRPGDTVVADATVKLSDGQRVRTIED